MGRKGGDVAQREREREKNCTLKRVTVGLRLFLVGFLY
jgi:hypothetical protein